MSDPNELFYEVDENDNPIGPITRKEANSNNQKYHRAINVFVKIGDKFLITIRRADKDTFPNKMDLSVSGHVNYNEEYINAAIRETEEEIDLNFDSESFIELGKNLVKMPNENEWQMNYFVMIDSNKGNEIKLKEASSLKYLTYDEMIKSIQNHPEEWATWAVETILKFRNKLSHKKIL